MNAKKLSFFSPIILVLIVSACGPSLPNQAAPATPVPTPIPVEGTPLTEVKYSAKGVLDVYMPEGQDGPFPTLLLIPAALNFRWDYKNVAEHLAGQGYAIVTALETGKVLHSSREAAVGELLTARLHQGQLRCRVEEIDNEIS